MKFLPKIVTLSLALALFGSVGAAQAQDSTIGKQTQNLSLDNSIDPVETSLENIEFAKITDKPTNFPEGAIVKEFGNGSLIVEVPNLGINRDKRLSVGAGRRIYVYFTPHEQAVLQTGRVAALGAMMCAMSTGLCPSIGVVTAMAMKFLDGRESVCPGRLEVSIGWGAGAKCV